MVVHNNYIRDLAQNSASGDIRADVGDEKLMTYGRFHAGIRNLCSFLDMINGSLISERVAGVPALQHFSENSHVTSQVIPS